MSENIKLDKQIIERAKIVACKIEDKGLRKRAYALNIAATAAAEYISSCGLSADIKNSLFRTTSFIENLELADVYVEGVRLDIRVTFNGKDFCVPKIQEKYNAMPYAYVVVQLDSALKKAKILGFVPSEDLELVKTESEYLYYETSVLKPMSGLKEFISTIELKQDIFSSVEHEKIKELSVAFIDEQISQSEKVYFIKHVLSCPVCREIFCDMNDFDMIVGQVKNYHELLNDSTLSVFAGNQKEFDEALLANLATVENAEEDCQDETLDDSQEGVDDLANEIDNDFDLGSLVETEEAVEESPEEEMSPEEEGSFLQDIAEPSDLAEFLEAGETELELNETEAEIDVLENESDSENSSAMPFVAVAPVIIPPVVAAVPIPVPPIGVDIDLDIDVDLNLDSDEELLPDMDFESAEDDAQQDEETPQKEEISQEPDLIIEGEDELLMEAEVEELSEVTLEETVNEEEPIEEPIEESIVELIEEPIEEAAIDEENIESLEIDDLEMIDSLDELEPIDAMEEITESDEVIEQLEPDSATEIEPEIEIEAEEKTPFSLSLEGEDEIPEEELTQEPIELVDEEEDILETELEVNTETEHKVEAESEAESDIETETETDDLLAEDSYEEDMIAEIEEEPIMEAPQEEIEQEAEPDDDSDLRSLLDDDLLALLSDDASGETVDTESKIESDSAEVVATEVEFENGTDETVEEIESEPQYENEEDEDNTIGSLFEGEGTDTEDGEQKQFELAEEPVSAKTVNATKKIIVGVAVLLLLAGGGITTWFMNNAKTNADNAALEGGQDGELFDLKNQAANPDSDTPAISQDINKSMANSFSDKPAAITITKISWQVSEKLAQEASVKEYLQTAGKNIQMNLQNDLANAPDINFNNSIKVSFEIAPDNTLKGIQVLESSGSDQIDEMISRSIRNTLKYIKVPQLKNFKSDYFLTLIINF